MPKAGVAPSAVRGIYSWGMISEGSCRSEPTTHMGTLSEPNIGFWDASIVNM
jgi:hypothetical protein